MFGNGLVAFECYRRRRVTCISLEWFLLVHLLFGKFRVLCIWTFRLGTWDESPILSLLRRLLRTSRNDSLIVVASGVSLSPYRSLTVTTQHVPVDSNIKNALLSWEYNIIASQLSPC